MNELRLVSVLGNCLQFRVTNGLVLELKLLLLEGFEHSLRSMVIVNVPLNLVVEEIQLLFCVCQSLINGSMSFTVQCFNRAAQIVGACPLFCFVFLTYFLQKLIPTSRMLSRAVSHQRQLRHRIIPSLIAPLKVGRMIRLTMQGTLRILKPLFRTFTTRWYLSQHGHSSFDRVIFVI